jgi:hypothetical protein
MIHDDLPRRMQSDSTMAAAFEILRSYQGIGDFLAYQLITDINYSELTNFSEMEFVAPGPGARSGIRKCFEDTAGLSDAEIIQITTLRQQEEFANRGIEFPTLWGRPLQLIDCQNLFCEVDKYARVACPEVHGFGRVRIKRRFVAHTQTVDYRFPPKWGINEQLGDFSRLQPVGALIGLS